MTKYYTTDDYADLFTSDSNMTSETFEERIEKLRDKKIVRYDVKTIKSGEILECEIYPIWDAPAGEREKLRKASRPAQERLNDRNAQKHLVRMVNTNFTKQDIWITLTYADDKIPTSREQAKKDMQNYIRRLKRYIKKHGLHELKYVYVTEHDGDKTKRVHHHMIMNFRDRDVAEELWYGGARKKSERLEPNEFGLEGLTRYIMKERKKKKDKQQEQAKSKTYTVSRNLDQPTVTVSKSKITRRRAEKIATEENLAPELFEKLYKNYAYNDMKVKYSPYVSGAYIYVRMRLIEPKPPKKRRGERMSKPIKVEPSRSPLNLFHAAAEREREEQVTQQEKVKRKGRKKNE